MASSWSRGEGSTIARRVARCVLVPAAAVLLAAAWGCAAPRQLYGGPALPPEKVALLRGVADHRFRDGAGGRGRSLAGSGSIVVIGLDGVVFNPKVHAAYSGSAFTVLPGRRELVAYCEYTAHEGGSAKAYYSDLFTLAFTALEGREYRIQAEFGTLRAGKALELASGGYWARPGVFDVTGGGASRVSDEMEAVRVVHRTLTRIQSAVRGL